MYSIEFLKNGGCFILHYKFLLGKNISCIIQITISKSRIKGAWWVEIFRRLSHDTRGDGALSDQNFELIKLHSYERTWP